MTKAERHFTVLFRRDRPDRPILECFWDARRTIHFRKTLGEDVKAYKRRAAAAKRGWKKRRAAA